MMNIGYEFKDKTLLKKALTHISYANEKGIESNQRLEFLGDSILSFVIAGYFYDNYQDLDEGRLTEMRAATVCEKPLAEAARTMQVGEMIRFGKSEAVCGGKDKDSILADAYESILAAIYLDGGIAPAREWVLRTLKETIQSAEHMDFKNYKTEIQMYYQKRDKGRDVVTYNLVCKSGPDHQPSFQVEAVYRGKVIGTGEGGSRKEAEQLAAKRAMAGKTL